jgi:hypothetical protein
MSKTLQVLETIVQEIKSPEHNYLTSKGWDYDSGPGEYHHQKSNHVILYHKGNGQHYVGGGKHGKVKTIHVGTAQQAHHVAMNS